VPRRALQPSIEERMMSKLLGTFALIAFGFALALGIADLGIRIANHWFHTSIVTISFADGVCSVREVT
jgi:integral membrane sensor domain MASE1